VIEQRHPQVRVARAGRLLNTALARVVQAARPGVRTGDLERLVRAVLAPASAVPAMLGYRDSLAESAFPAAVSISLNSEICGGNDPARIVQPGDLITADLVVRLGEWHADAACTWVIPGPGDADRRRLAEASRRVTAAAVRQVRPGVCWSGVVAAMAAEASRLGVHLVRGYDGHGLGRELHAPPRLPMHPEDLKLFEPVRLGRGMILAVEPVIAATDTGSVRSGWLEKTRNGSDACFTEVTIVVGGAGFRPGPRRNCRVLAGFLDAAVCMT